MAHWLRFQNVTQRSSNFSGFLINSKCRYVSQLKRHRPLLSIPRKNPATISCLYQNKSNCRNNFFAMK
ncbi:uncharacterized protein LOC111099416 isoform X2 [Crassostrea virginica]